MFIFPAGAMPCLEARQRLGLAVAESGAEQSTSSASLMKLADPIKEDNADKLESKAEQHVSLGLGLPAIPLKVVEKIHNWKYVDFSEFPPAKVRGKTASVESQGATVMVRAKKLVTDFTTWARCYDILMLVACRKHPARWEDLLAYRYHIAGAAIKFGWPHWVAYDDNFREAIEGDHSRLWAQGDPVLFTTCLAGMGAGQAGGAEQQQNSWQRSTGRAPKRSWSAAMNGSRTWHTDRLDVVCQKFNRYNGDCKFGPSCKFRHVCSSCGGAHPASRCTSNQNTEEQRSQQQ